MNLNKKTQIAIISHFAFKDEGEGEVFPQNIRNFLLKKIGKLMYIEHPFPEANFPSSQMTIYSKGVENYQLTSPKIKLPTLILFIYQFFVTIFFFLVKPGKYDLCIACDNLSLIVAFVFKKIGFIYRVVYYTVDYTPQRYASSFLNNLYHYIDRVASKISDMNWITVENTISAKVQNGLDLKKSAPFQIVPIGFSKKNILVKPSNETKKFNLIFVGVLYEKQGLQLVIKVLPKIIKKYPKINLTIIGSGPYENKIKGLVKQYDMATYVRFTGYINDQKKVLELLGKGGVGLATYVPALGDFTYFADPSKIKLYLLCGIPVITTRVPPISKEIKTKKSGLVIDYSEEDLIKNLTYLLEGKRYFLYRNNALKMSMAFDNNLILDKAFKELPWIN